MGRAYLVVEGHGEVEAARNLVIRLWADLGLPLAVWGAPKRGKALNDFGALRVSGARSFRTLENALRFLAAPGALGVYPPPRP
ncbi:hypothetical protein WME75_22385 [Sorangium sp. So ce1014]|uniref:hypothetical protein n=1 Tax=Sorangium sp. So ce1014 TaxID=3133326 RepID=UPI003F64185E